MCASRRLRWHFQVVASLPVDSHFLENQLARQLGVLDVFVYVFPSPEGVMGAHLVEFVLRSREDGPAAEVPPLELPPPAPPEVHLGPVSHAPPPALDLNAGPPGLDLLAEGPHVLGVML